jgi:hypothetical protein
MKLRLIIFLIFLFSLNLNANYSTDLSFDLDFINSKGLNRITDGFNKGYLTNFKKIKIIKGFRINFAYNFYENYIISLGSGYDFTSSKSYSNFYDVSQSVKYYDIPINMNFKYIFYKLKNFSFLASLGFGTFFSKLILATTPYVDSDNTNYKMNAWGYSVKPGLEFVYNINKSIFIFTGIFYRYTKTAKYKYSKDINNHKKGEIVTFMDGSSLTLNLSSVKFSLGILYYWG